MDHRESRYAPIDTWPKYPCPPCLDLKRIGACVGRSVDTGLLIRGPPDNLGNIDFIALIKFIVGHYIDEIFIDGIGVYVFSRGQGQICAYGGGHVHV